MKMLPFNKLAMENTVLVLPPKWNVTAKVLAPCLAQPSPKVIGHGHPLPLEVAT